ncbi:MAG: hypothetical protein QG671_989 [Actinomycetota bacterium]|nr:hypothetical protein [Actinomycetota bacterium]
MSGRRARQGRSVGERSVYARQVGLLSGIKVPGGYTVRLARPGEGADVARLARLAGVDVELDDAEAQAVDDGLAGAIATRVLQDGDHGLRALAEHWVHGLMQVALASMAPVVATHPDHPGPVGLCLTGMPGNVVANAVNAGVGEQPVMLLTMQLGRLRAVAVDPGHRGAGLGTAMLAQAAMLATARNGDLYGQIERPELADWYAARGFRVLPPGHGLDMAWLIDVPLVVFPGNRQERIVIRTPQPGRRLFVVDPSRECRAHAWLRP